MKKLIAVIGIVFICSCNDAKDPPDEHPPFTEVKADSNETTLRVVASNVPTRQVLLDTTVPVYVPVIDEGDTINK